MKINSNCIHINVASIGIISEYNFGDYIEIIPHNWHAAILKYQNFDDKRRALLARMMLSDLLDKMNFSIKKDIKYNNWGKPEVIDAPYFNWSHSGDYVVFAWSDVVEIGIDIEKKNEIKWREFNTTFNKQQWSDIFHSDDSTTKFYYYWVINEAIIKAKGMGLSFDVKKIGLIYESQIIVDNEEFKLKAIDVDPEYLCYLAFRNNQTEFNIRSQLYESQKL